MVHTIRVFIDFSPLLIVSIIITSPSLVPVLRIKVAAWSLWRMACHTRDGLRAATKLLEDGGRRIMSCFELFAPHFYDAQKSHFCANGGGKRDIGAGAKDSMLLLDPFQPLHFQLV
jgi:hypothetical protein